MMQKKHLPTSWSTMKTKSGEQQQLGTGWWRARYVQTARQRQCWTQSWHGGRRNIRTRRKARGLP
eukprot:3609288-Rhodomonas_salina.1